MKIIRKDISQIPEILNNNNIYFVLNDADKLQSQIITSGCSFPSKEYVDESVSGFTEELSEKVSKGELATKQDKLVNGYGINIDASTNIISSTLDVSLIKLVNELPTTDIDINKIYVLINQTKSNSYEEYIYIDSVKQWEKIGEVATEIDLSEYLKSTDAEKTYMKLTNGAATVTFSSAGSMQNYGDNGQAFNAIRKVTSAQSVTGKEYNAGSFGVKLDGTTAFSHKIYNTYDEKTGQASGAKNTAVLTFSGPTGLRYAKNTGSASDVTDAMYRYVGVIDSPDDKQKVYSAKQVDDIISGLTAQIEVLTQRIEQLEK